MHGAITIKLRKKKRRKTKSVVLPSGANYLLPEVYSATG